MGSPKKTPSPKGGKRRRTLKLSKSLFSPMLKRVSFHPDATLSSETPPSTETSSSEVAPLTSRGSTSCPPRKTISSTQTKKGNDPKKRRKPKKTSYKLFSSAANNVKVRPSNTLTAQLNYTLVVLPSKLKDLEKDIRLCHAERIHQLDKLESNLLKRLETISSLKLDNKDDALIDKKYEVIEEMEEKILEVQKLKERRQQQLDEARPGLRANHSMRFVCCLVCAIRGDD